MKTLATITTQEKRELLRHSIATTHGRFFGLVNKKKDGSEREYKGVRTGVVKHLRGGSSTTAHKAHLVTIFEPQSESYKAVNLDTVSRFTFKGKSLLFIQDGNSWQIKEATA